LANLASLAVKNLDPRLCGDERISQAHRPLHHPGVARQGPVGGGFIPQTYIDGMDALIARNNPR
jgi:hypothetical protein